MKRILPLLLLLTVPEAKGQIWGSYGDSCSWLFVNATFNQECNASFRTYGGAWQHELDDYGLETVGSGREGYGYYEFWGQWEMYPPDTAN